MSNFLSFFRSTIPIGIGVTIGVGISILFLFNSIFIIERGILFGTIAGIAIFSMLILFRLSLNIKRRSEKFTYQQLDDDEISHIIQRVIPNQNASEIDIQKFTFLTKSMIKNGIALWSSIAAAGLGMAAVGAIIAMIGTHAAIQQVGRIDAQNELIQQQITEAHASRISSIFSAQLPSLLQQIYQEKGEKKTWNPSPSLISRIASISNSVEPYRKDQTVENILGEALDLAHNSFGTDVMNENKFSEWKKNEPKRFSPERGLLLKILASAGMNFEGLSLNFKAADLKGAKIKIKDFGSIDLSFSNLYSAELVGDVSFVKFRGAILPYAESLFVTLAAINDDETKYYSYELLFDGAIMPSQSQYFMSEYENPAGKFEDLKMGGEMNPVRMSLFRNCEYKSKITYSNGKVAYLLLNNFHYC